jgi:hypothetical protein
VAEPDRPALVRGTPSSEVSSIASELWRGSKGSAAIVAALLLVAYMGLDGRIDTIERAEEARRAEDSASAQRLAAAEQRLAAAEQGLLALQKMEADQERSHREVARVLQEALYVGAADTRATWDALSAVHRAVAPTAPTLKLPEIEARYEALRAALAVARDGGG